jgi:4,5:9,10-diseco-3-hydroxy-5,9,17-trioxoandrosta-1(10),2-diene-4-oate hydrolase
MGRHAPSCRSRRSLLILLAAWPFTLSSISCTDLILVRYRDDAYLRQHRYALGEQYIQAGGIRFCYQEFGSGNTVLILPGLGTNLDYWQLNVPALAEHHRVVAVDLPGFGKTDKPDACYELPWIRDRLVAFMDAKGLDRVTLMGASMGGHLALLIALQHPHRVDKLVLMGSSGIWPTPGVLAHLGFHTFWTEWLVTDHLRRAWPSIFRRVFSRHTPMTDEILRYQMAERADYGRFLPEGRASSRALRSIFYNTCRHRLREIRQPVLFICGESDPIHTAEDAIFFRTHLPDCRLVVVSDASHAVMADKPETFNRLVLAFLEHGTAGVQDTFPAP